MTDKKLLAQHLYLNAGKTQKEIAMEVGVSERTVFTWIHQHAWDKLRRAAYQAPAAISENLCSELIELQNAIAAREPGKRYPNQQEAEVIRKLINAIEKMKKYPSLSQNMQMMEVFKNYVRPIDPDFTRQLARYAERFLEGKSVNGFAPYQMEYGIEQVAPVMSFYDEPVEEPKVCPKYGKECSCETINACPDPDVYTEPCTGIDACLHPGACTAPHCRRTKQLYNKLYGPPPAKKEVQPVPAITAEERIRLYHKYMEDNGFGTGNPLPQDPQKPEITGSFPAILQTRVGTENFKKEAAPVISSNTNEPRPKIPVAPKKLRILTSPKNKRP